MRRVKYLVQTKTPLIALFTNKAFATIFFLAALLRICIFFLLPPNTPSNLGPDEGTYGALARWVSESKPVNDFPTYGPGLYNTARSLILPSALFVKLGLAEIQAVRLTSLIYGLLSIVVLGALLLLVSRLKSSDIRFSDVMAQKYFVVTLIIFSFLPSNLIWSTLGLRETASAFWIMLSFFSIMKLFKNRDNFETLLWGGLLVLSLVLSYGARRETAFVFTVVLFLLSFYLLLTTKAIVPIVALIIGLLLGHSFTLTPSPDRDTNSTLPTLAESPLQSISNQLLTIKILEYKRNVNRLDAQSALPESKCQEVESAQLNVILCNFSELPYRLFAFLFRPLPILDSGSLSLTLAGIENIFWIAFLSYVIFLYSTFIRYSGSQRTLLITLGAYFAIFSTAAALYEGNLGTAFRHKSTLLWVCVSIIYISSINRESRKDSA
jgi:hypothetical protein